MIMRIVAIVAIILVIAIIILLIKKKYLKNECTHSFQMDRPIKNVKNKVNGNSTVYMTNLTISRYIDKYVVSHKKGKKILMCHYKRKVSDISYFILVYNKKEKLQEVIEVTDNTPKDHSQAITLPMKTKLVNIVLKDVEGAVINERVFENPQKAKVVKFSLFVTIALLFGLFSLRQLMIELFGVFFADEYNDRNLIIDAVIILAFVIVFGIFSRIYLLKKTGNTKKKEVESRG